MPEAAPPAAPIVRTGLPSAAEQTSLDGTKARLVSETRVIHRRAWRNLTVQIHEEPSHVEPTMVAGAPETQISLQLSGALHLRFDKDDGSRHRPESLELKRRRNGQCNDTKSG